MILHLHVPKEERLLVPWQFHLLALEVQPVAAKTAVHVFALAPVFPRTQSTASFVQIEGQACHQRRPGTAEFFYAFVKLALDDLVGELEDA
jgi:hypothetical protein